MRVELLQYQNNFYANARKEAQSGTYIFGNEKDASSAYHLAEILKRHQINIYNLKNDITENGKNFKKGYSYVVPKNQKQSRLLKAMFEKRTSFRDSLFYDISAWTFPLSFNLDVIEKSNTTDLGSEIKELDFIKNKAINKSTYAYLMEWHEYYTPSALYLSLIHI